MESTITEIAISVVTLVSAWFIGNKSVWGQRLGLLANFGWWFYVVAFKRYGLIPMEVVFTFMGIRNLIKWEKENRNGNRSQEVEHRDQTTFIPRSFLRKGK